MRGKFCDKGGIHAEIGQGYGHVGLSAAIGGSKVIRLDKAVKSLRREPEHDLAKGDDSLAHFVRSFYICDWTDGFENLCMGNQISL